MRKRKKNAHRRRRRVIHHHRNPRRVTAHSHRRRRVLNPRRHHILHRRRRHLRRRRNPFGSSWKNISEMSLSAVVAGVFSRVLPEKFAANYNDGATGYALNLLSGVIVSYGLGLTPLKENGSLGGVVGTVAMVGGRIISDRFGKTVVQFSPLTPSAGSHPAAAAVPSGVSGLGRFGDPAFNLGRYVKPYPFPLPSANNPPAPALATSASSKHAKPTKRF